ncbi:Gfo/Idh/MocA family protein [uncultured Ruthenibacterium sp.]|uniref:Gfo/Idh/MocA family protein n=1 Tax=uncultured Ruthenibacterium sp. TaxID=1905347 RepID=UPI00349E5FEF
MLRFAILTAGNIAHKMAQTIAAVPGMVEPYAIAARSAERAAELARECGFAKSYGSYEELFADPNVDIVYIGSTHNFHPQHVRMALNAGKHVLCEKPLTVNATLARELFALADEKGLVLTEATWTRFQPAIHRLRQILDAGEIGRVLGVSANMGCAVAEKPRIALPELAGGILLDLSIYPLTIADIALGPAVSEPTGVCVKNENGVDVQEVIQAEYADGRLASLFVTGRAVLANTATVWGDKGRVTLRGNFWHTEALDVYNAAGHRTVELPFEATGYEYEVRAIVDAVNRGARECPDMPRAATLRILEQMDALRKAWNIRYPFE